MHAHLNRSGKSYNPTRSQKAAPSDLSSCYNSHLNTRFLQRNPLAKLFKSSGLATQSLVLHASNSSPNPSTDQFDTGTWQVPQKQGTEIPPSEHWTSSHHAPPPPPPKKTHTHQALAIGATSRENFNSTLRTQWTQDLSEIFSQTQRMMGCILTKAPNPHQLLQKDVSSRMPSLHQSHTPVATNPRARSRGQITDPATKPRAPERAGRETNIYI